jgi:hypothetical protein
MEPQMDEQVAGSVALGLVALILLAFLALFFLPRGGAGSLLFAVATVLVTVIALAAVTEGRRS